MRKPVYFLILFLAVIVVGEGTASAQEAYCQELTCYIYVHNLRFFDEDCDGVVGFDNDLEAVDNCPCVRNGDCDLNPVNCNIDGSDDSHNNDTVDGLEMQAGNQADWNHNGVGDACDDTDADGVPDYLDICKSVWNPDQDARVCTDTDHDRFEDPIDNCPINYNPSQQDSDLDGVGDACDTCLLVPNPDQNPAACKGSPPGAPQITPSASVGTQPGGSTPPPARPDHIEGNGGCGLVQGASSYYLAGILASLAALGSITIRRKF